MLCAIVIWIVNALLSPSTGRSSLRSIGLAVSVMAVSGLIGKLIGLAVARVRLYFAVQSLRKLALERSGPHDPSSDGLMSPLGKDAGAQALSAKCQ